MSEDVVVAGGSNDDNIGRDRGERGRMGDQGG